MYQIDDALQSYVESGVATIVGTGDERGRPEVAYAWGPRVRADRRLLDIFLDLDRSDVTLANLHANGRIAVTFADPVTLRSVQFKGRFVEQGEATEDDREWVQRQREAFLVTTSLVGDPPSMIRNLWMEQVVRVTLEVDQAFDQTPGPDAGRPL